MVKYSWFRLWAIISKEFIQMRRDRATFAMIVAIPIMQLIMFGYAINNDPKHLPTAVVSADQSNWSRTFLQGLQNSGYFNVDRMVNEAEAKRLLATGQTQFVVNIPPNFAHDLVRGARPSVLIEADATDPVTTGNALASVNTIAQSVFNLDLQGALHYLNGSPPPIDVRIHALYNPEILTQYNIVPGLMGVILTMTMVMITSIAVTRERERGTMENLLATPVQPGEVMVGKVIPYIMVGYIQVSLILIFAHLLFSVPVLGSVIVLLLVTLPFIAANLSVGLLLSAIAQNQLQAVQMTIFYFLPSLLLSGFMFPFRGMPVWAQVIGEMLPLTHYLRIVRGIMLKGNGWLEILPNLWPILLFLLMVVLLGIKRFHRTLD